jgi:hypothetical protein
VSYRTARYFLSRANIAACEAENAATPEARAACEGRLVFWFGLFKLAIMSGSPEGGRE